MTTKTSIDISEPLSTDPERALAAVVALRHQADHLELLAVAAALDQGWSWSDIAQALGVSKQAAHKRLSPLVTAMRKPSR
ncbi:DNA-directed RNA polymerase specialized sigma24 family protein [Chitinivorax tropicus]|uniref:DNA-directed RNA polymerase specialized sigma24 family protein n=1 Tax=Chitinivorax tropicus TaxID=714531 RepID=A0A840MQY0_9PROT|nr:helix-turn-helix domain-containing protein [Chitinivorax tropicus]MBB5019835.1 DNA-directed RNA polymerase specialized sigma24 family protein [Chitinivorax tropicus]